MSSCFLAGCDRIKSTAKSILNSHRLSKESHVRPARPSAVTGPRLAIILDDVASDPAAVDAILTLHYPLTLALLPSHPRSPQIAEQAYRRGYEIMLHLPMQSLAGELPESRELRVGMSSTEISKSLSEMLISVPHAVGVNNHQGSLATSDPRLMAELMLILRGQNLFFIDSRTTASTIAYDAARSAGVPSAFRNAPFLDDIQDTPAIRKQLELAIRNAKDKGAVIAIGHPHPETLRALKEMLPQAEAQGVHLVYASDLVR